MECLPTAPILPHLSTSPCLNFTSQDLASSCCYDKMPSRHLLINSGFPLNMVEAVKSKIKVLTGLVSVGPFSVSHRLLALSSHARGPSCVLGLYMRQKNLAMRLHPLHDIIPSQRYHLLIPSYKVKFCLEHLKHTDMGL